tara:strand:- start:465 stop:1973 length:1509 start_codon:yes stop_codon:yes gene_type:complete
MPELFGFSFGRKKSPDTPLPNAKSFIPPEPDDGATTVASGGFYGSYLDLEGDQKSESGFVNHYRMMVLQPEVEIAVQDIVNESIVFDEYRTPVKLNMDHYEQSESIKKKINTEFKEILSLLDFNNKGIEIFRKWFVDGRLFFHKIVDEKNNKKGIIELRSIDPTRIKKVREVEKEKNKDGVEIVKKVNEFFVYDLTPKTNLYTPSFATKGIKVSPDAICYATSGLFDTGKKRVIGYLHKAIRPLNQLRMIEDSVVIYRISRAPERRVFYVDVGNLPKNKAEQYLKGLMNQYRNKLVYDASTGEIKDDKKHMNMLEDYWLPRREGGRGTEISTLDGGQNLGEMEDVQYFQKKLFRALNIPTSRLEAENGFNMGRSAEITRDEVRFFKFIQRLRDKFSDLFMDLLKTQLILKGIITADDWKEIGQNAFIEYATDSYFTELKESEILKERMEVLREVNEYIGKYYSIDWVRKNILKFNETEIKEMDNDMAKEKEDGLYNEGEEDY